MWKLVRVRDIECAGFRLSERGNENENVLSEKGPKGIEEMKKGGKRRSWEEMKVDDQKKKKIKDGKINEFD